MTQRHIYTYIYIYLVDVKHTLKVFWTCFARTFVRWPLFGDFDVHDVHLRFVNVFSKFFLALYFCWPSLDSCRTQTTWRPAGRRFRSGTSLTPTHRAVFSCFCIVVWEFFTATMPCPLLEENAFRVSGWEQGWKRIPFVVRFLVRSLNAFYLCFLNVPCTFSSNFYETNMSNTFVRKTC